MASNFRRIVSMSMQAYVGWPTKILQLIPSDP